MIVSGFRNEMRSSRRTRLRDTTNFAISSALSTTKVLTPKSSACRMSEPRLIGCVCTQRPGGMPASRTRSTSPFVARSNQDPSRASTCTTVRSGSGFSA